jgi:hypothetical protein
MSLKCFGRKNLSVAIVGSPEEGRRSLCEGASEDRWSGALKTTNYFEQKLLERPECLL